MSLFEDTNPRALKDLLAEVHSRAMVLPVLQRDFAWEPEATQELIVSFANIYPSDKDQFGSQTRNYATTLAVLGGVA